MRGFSGEEQRDEADLQGNDRQGGERNGKGEEMRSMGRNEAEQQRAVSCRIGKDWQGKDRDEQRWSCTVVIGRAQKNQRILLENEWRC